VEGEISFTFDSWTSESSHPYLLVTAHYIDSPKDQLDQWVIRKAQFTFVPLEGPHTGANITSVISSMLDWYDICEKVRDFIYIIYSY